MRISIKKLLRYGEYYKWSRQLCPKYCFNKLTGTVVKSDDLYSGSGKTFSDAEEFFESLPEEIVPFFVTDILDLKLEFARKYFDTGSLIYIEGHTGQECDSAFNKILNEYDMYRQWYIYEEAALKIDCITWAGENDIQLSEE